MGKSNSTFHHKSCTNSPIFEQKTKIAKGERLIDVPSSSFQAVQTTVLPTVVKPTILENFEKSQKLESKIIEQPVQPEPSSAGPSDQVKISLEAPKVVLKMAQFLPLPAGCKTQ